MKEQTSSVITRSLRFFVMLLVFAAISQCAAATVYVTLNSGCLHVFPDSCVASTTLDEQTLVFTTGNGQVFSYRLADVRSIDNVLNKSLPSLTGYGFDRDHNYQVIGDSVGTITGNEVHVSVVGIGKRLTADFSLSDDDARAWVDGVEQVSGVSRIRFDSSRTYVVGYPGDLILLPASAGGYAMQPFGRNYRITVDFLTDHSVSVPRIDINTVGGVDITSKVDYLDAEIIIDGAGVFPSMTDSVKVRGRGNTSWSTKPGAKNPYRLKFAEKTKPLGLHKGKNWVLLANRRFGSMLTNAYGMKAASLIGTAAANHIIPVELYINGTYKGNYNFTEKVGFHNNSVDLDDESAAAMLELDRYFDEAEGQKFRSTPREIPVNVKFPEFGKDATLITLDDIENRFNGFVSAVVNGDDLAPHVDIDKLARYLLANELICNKDIFHPKSVFCYHENILEDSCKFIFGPMWDLDWGCGCVMGWPETYFTELTDFDFFNSNYSADQYDFFSALSKNKLVSRRMYEIWSQFMHDGIEELCEFCQDYYQYAAPSLVNNRTAYNDSVDYAEQAAKAPAWFRARAQLMLNRLMKDNLIHGDINGDGEISVSDINALIDIILREETLLMADVNSDGEISISDINALIDLILKE